jgi:hypothetical protein
VSDVVERLIAKGLLQPVPQDQLRTERLLDDAARHLGSAEKALDGDLAGAYQLAYDGARKAVTALLAAQGLRVRARAGHSMLVEVVVALYGGHEGGDVLAQLDRMRRIRNEAEYAGLGLMRRKWPTT